MTFNLGQALPKNMNEASAGLTVSGRQRGRVGRGQGVATILALLNHRAWRIPASWVSSPQGLWAGTKERQEPSAQRLVDGAVTREV